MAKRATERKPSKEMALDALGRLALLAKRFPKWRLRFESAQSITGAPTGHLWWFCRQPKRWRGRENVFTSSEAMTEWMVQMVQMDRKGW